MVFMTPPDAKVKDEVLDIFVQEIRNQFDDRLKQVILFGSRARRDHASDSDYDCLVVLDEVSATEFSKAINQLFRERQTGDYEFDLSLTEEEAREDIQLAERMVQAIKMYLTEEGVL